MRLVYLAAGAAGTYCGACRRDAVLAREILRRGHDLSLLPVYSPLHREEGWPAPPRIFLGGLNLCLRQHLPWLERAPAFFRRWLDHPVLLNSLARLSLATDARKLGALTAAVLEGRAGRQAGAWNELLAHLERNPRPDAVILSNSLLSALAPEARERLGVPVLCHWQGEDSFILALPEPWRARVLDLLRAHARAVSLFLTPCAAQARAMSALLETDAARIREVPPGLDPPADLPARRPPGSNFRVGALSAIRPAKGQDLLLEACGLLPADGRRPVELRLAGRVFEKDFFRRLRNRAPAGVDFAWAGELKEREKWAFLSACAAVALPSRIAEARGMAALEAQAAGVPVLLPAQGIFPEMLARTGGGLLFPPGDAGALAEALGRLRADPEWAERLGARGRAGVQEHYSAARAAEAFLAACREAAG